MENVTDQPTAETPVGYEYDYSGDFSDFAKARPCRPVVVQNFARVFAPVLYSLVLVLGVLGNAMVILVIGRYKKARRTVTDTFILHLAAADLLLVVTLPFWAVEAVWGWVFGPATCKIVGAVFALNLYSGILFLACISFDRYLAIVHAVHMYKKRRPAYIHATCLLVWLFCLALATVELVFREEYHSVYLNSTVCTYGFDPDSARAWHLALRLAHHLVGFFAPMAAMLYCYCLIFRTLCRAQMLERQKTLKVVVAIVTVFVGCWLPYNAVLFADTLRSLDGLAVSSCGALNALDIGRTVTQSLGLVHSCLNPLLYAFIGVKFRREALGALAGLGCRRDKAVAARRRAGRNGRASSAISDSDTSTSYSMMW
uniref:C-X-C chemokine receptor type 3-2-like n=1 Tax=Pristiophorus japonicus TaxID=55135 RepID=UPI00398F7B16